ncbi:peroxisomal biogenesis factor 11 [Xylaria venustula]|nr:peroxisomal biogenesis factor 11 [Xylaria venustula]
MASTFEQFVRFTTDAAGLERTFRLFQSIAQILSSYTLPFETLLLFLSLSTSTAAAAANPASTHAVLVSLRGQLALARRYFRLFRFLESFQAAQKLYLSLSSTSTSTATASAGGGRSLARTATWIDVFGRTFNGMYLLLEASAILDAQKIPGLAVWGAELEPKVAFEGQRFWLFSLVCGVLAGLVRIAELSAPASASSTVTTSADVDADEKRGSDGGMNEMASEGVKGDERQGGQAQEEQRKRAAEARERRAKISGLRRRVVADALDITLPGSVVGWVPASTGTVGLAMFVTTILTSIDIWERCGREVAGSGK